MKILTKDLKKISRILLNLLDELEIDEIDLDHDFYWDVPQALRYDPYSKPNELSLGQLEDDWQELLAILNSKKEPFPYAFVWLAAVLRKLGEDLVS